MEKSAKFWTWVQCTSLHLIDRGQMWHWYWRMKSTDQYTCWSASVLSKIIISCIIINVSKNVTRCSCAVSLGSLFYELLVYIPLLSLSQGSHNLLWEKKCVNEKCVCRNKNKYCISLCCTFKLCCCAWYKLILLNYLY